MGDYVHLEALEDRVSFHESHDGSHFIKLQISTVNGSRSVFALFTLRRSFFERYEFMNAAGDRPVNNNNTNNTNNTNRSSTLSCKVLLKVCHFHGGINVTGQSLLSLFKIKSGGSTEKNVEKCRIRFQTAAEQESLASSRLVIQFQYAHGK